MRQALVLTGRIRTEKKAGYKMSIDNIGDMKGCGHAEYRRIYDKHKENLTVFSSYSGGILGMPQMSTAWGIRGMETALIASECEDLEHRREDPDAWTYWKNADLVAALDRASSAESSLAAMRQRAQKAIDNACADREAWKHLCRLEADGHKQACVDRDAAIARAERAEDALEDIKTTIEDQLDESPHGDDHVNCFLESLKMKANAALSSPPADATKMGGGRERRLANSLDEILNYSGGADNALKDEYVMERAHAALAEMEKKA